MASRQLSTQDAFLLVDNAQGKMHVVTLCGLRNDENGNRRYEATVVDLTDIGARGKTGAFRYRFTGHCMAPAQEAEWALNHLHAKQAQ